MPTQRLIDAIRERRIDLISATIGPVGNGDNRYRESVEGIASFNRLIATHSRLLAKIEGVTDIRAARAAGKVGMIYNFQDTTALEGDASRVDTFATLGIRVIQLTYNKRNLAGDGCLERANAGLSDFGREVIARMNPAHVLLDLSHAGQRTLAEGIAASTRLPAITHSGCRALVDLPRNAHDAEMRALAEKGGVFGLYLMPFLRTSGSGGAGGSAPPSRSRSQRLRRGPYRHRHRQPFPGYRSSTRRAGSSGILRGAQPRASPHRAKRRTSSTWSKAITASTATIGSRATSAARLARGRIDKVLGDNFVRLFGEVWRG